MKALRYISVIVLGILGVVIAVLTLGQTKNTPLDRTKHDLEVIKADTKTKKLQAQVGIDEARRQIEKEYEDDIAKLDENQKVRRKYLRNNPRKLSAFLLDAARSNRRGG